MKHAILSRSVLFLLAQLVVPLPFASAAILLESGTLGPTGVPFSELVNGNVPSSSIRDVVFTGVRFELTQPVITSQIGGHFVAPANGTFFGAIVRLDDANDFPNSGDIENSSDVLGSTLLTFPTLSNEVFGDITLNLDAGWYVLVFGSGHFGAAGDGATVRNGMDIGNPSYIGHQPGADWFNLTALPSSFENHRFLITGISVPEPTTLFLVLISFSSSMFLRGHII